MRTKLLIALINLFIMAFGLNHGWADRVDDLIKQLKDPNPDVYIKAVNELWEIGDKRAIPELERMAKEDKEESVRNAANKALEKIASKLAVPTAVNPMGKKVTTLGAMKRGDNEIHIIHK